MRPKRKLAAVTRETKEENPRKGQSRNTSVPRINEEYITQVSEEIEGRVTKKLSQEFSRTEYRILGTLSKLNEFLLNQEIRTHFGTVPGTFRNTNVENQGTNEDESQSDPHPEVGPSVCQSRHSIDSDTGEAHDTMTGVIEQTTKDRHMVTGVGCRSISAKPTSIKKGKDIPKLPENYKKLYQYFSLFHFHSYNNVAVVFHCFYI